MCQQIIHFCSGSTKPLLFGGGAVTFLLAIAIGYTGCTNQALYKDLDANINEQDNSLKLTYYLQLISAGYLIFIALLTCFAAHCDQKQTIRGLAIITSINFVLAASAILMLPHGQPVLSLFDGRLTRAQQLYNFTDKYLTLNESALQTTSTTPAATSLPSITLLSPEQNDASELKQRTVRQSASLQLNQLSNNSNSTDKLEKLSPSEATKIWDQLQARGPCCGLHNATIEWQPDRIPKSCCSQPVEDSKGQMVCKSIDNEHNKPCACVIESASMNVLFLLALIAFASLYLATVSGVSTYRTFHYNEASQNAYG